MKKITRTDKEIEAEIKRICDDSDNFTSDNYGSEAADNGFFEIYYSEYLSEKTLTNFLNWLTTKNIENEKK